MDSGYQFREGSLKAFQKHHEEDREQDGHKDKNDRKRNHPLQCEKPHLFFDGHSSL